MSGPYRALGGGAEAHGEPVSLPITSVVLLEDRAVVTRSGRAAVGAGTWRLELRDVAPTLADKTLTARVDGARLHDVRVRREALRRTDDRGDEARAIAEEVATLEAAVARAGSAARALALEVAHLRSAHERAIDEIAEDAAWGRLDRAAASASLDRLSDLHLAGAVAEIDAAAELEELVGRLQDKLARARAIDSPSSAMRAWIEIDVEAGHDGGSAPKPPGIASRPGHDGGSAPKPPGIASRPGHDGGSAPKPPGIASRPGAQADVDVTLSYVVPGACWRPQHTATDLGGDDVRVRFACEATVWQRTGEEWSDVELVFSTARPSLGADPPDLASDVLGVTRRSPTIAVEAREQRVEEAGRGAGAMTPKGLPGIDDGGETKRWAAGGRHTVPSDGRPHRVPLFEFESGGARDLIATPELALAVFERTELTNAAARPILAGPVDLVRAGGPAGKATVLFVAPGEKFLLGWGPVDSLRVRRDVEPLPEHSTFFGGWATTTEDVVVRLSNLAGSPRRVIVRERVPVSEIEKVEVAVLPVKALAKQAISNGAGRVNPPAYAGPDSDGFVTWTLDLPARGRELLRLRKAIKRHADVIG